ncbi:helix-turn-helix domain-containing protein [unidentified bacterial endosymbiont]|jgi:CRP-like cAMP-binding protein|uniref:helix-turn-helix domain-containing protein n=1 Tax=unidentified bacterial endosymbiont TaxID=2355 RepID=UPI00209FDCF5|nr:helix-turn-helix domain-containing protein [unidentified bacterial endosymbiont]
MLSTYGKSTRPQAEIEAIVAATAGHEEKTLRKWQRISTTDADVIHIIVSGEVDFRRASDDLCMFHLQGQCIFGLAAINYHSSHMHGVVRSNTLVRTINKDQFYRLMDSKGLWPALTKVLAWYICLLSKRDDVLVSRSAYSIVREFLLEINELVVHHHRDINIYDYIQSYTHLARSTIIKILAELKKGHYIVVEKGRLLSLTTLPEKF